MKRFFIALTALLLASSAVKAEEKRSFGYNDISKGLFAQRSVYGVRSMEDGEHYTSRNGGTIVRYRYKDGAAVDTLFKVTDKMPFENFNNYEFNADENKILLTTAVEPVYRRSFKAQYYIYNIVDGSLKPLSDKGAQQVASFSPDGSKAAFVRDNNLFWVDLSNGREHQITTDGKFNHILNGIPDWVYEEEYTFSKAYQWSPTSDAIAFYKSNESRVKEYNMNMFEGELYPTVYSFKYPKAGEENSIVEIYTYNLESGKTIKNDTGAETDQYIPRIKWTEDSNNLAIFKLNRLQNSFDLLVSNATTGGSKVIYSEKNPRYIERINDQVVTFLPDGKHFIIKNETDGFMHLYLYDIESGLVRQITKGEWEVTSILGYNSKKSLIYYTSTEESPLRRALYSIDIKGKNKRRLTPKSGTYSVNFSNGNKYFISYFSSATEPLEVTLCDANGKTIRVLEDNAALKERIKNVYVPAKEFFTFKTPQGVELNGYMLKPQNFDPAKKYPLFMTQYSGPGSQSVADSWGIGWESALVADGYIVACVDGRGTGFRGEEFRKCTYGNMGAKEVEDQIYAAKYLGTQPYIDSTRIGIYGWSYGGFMALNAILKGNNVFKAAIAVAPVTSWRYYDTIYTEVYNGLPQQNPAGYDNNSPINYADRLKGKLLIAHGTADDNVHIQNTYEMIAALTRAGKQFETAIYPDQNHGMGSDHDNLMIKSIKFIKENL